MPKKILFESAVHQFAMAAKELLLELRKAGSEDGAKLERFVSTWQFQYDGPGKLILRWQAPSPGEMSIPFPQAKFYTRGDADSYIQKQKALELVDRSDDAIAIENRAYFKGLVSQALAVAHGGESHGR